MSPSSSTSAALLLLAGRRRPRGCRDRGTPPTPSMSRAIAPPSASRYFFARSGSSGSRRLAALRNSRPASPPRRCASATGLAAPPRSPDSSRASDSMPASSSSALSRSSALRLAPAAASRRWARRLLSGVAWRRARGNRRRLRSHLAPGPTGGTLELGRHLLVGCRSGLRAVPGAAVRIGSGSVASASAP